jgi:hypothetical protein
MAPSMTVSTERHIPSWSWGADWHLWACRLSHLLGLVALLAMLVLLGVVTAGS